jgi:hypothetical protein
MGQGTVDDARIECAVTGADAIPVLVFTILVDAVVARSVSRLVAFFIARWVHTIL